MCENTESEALGAEPASADVADREEVLAMLTRTMRAVQARIDDSDPETPADERLLIQWIKTHSGLTHRFQQLKSATDLDEIADRLELFEEANELQRYR